MLKLKLQYFGHLMWRTDSFEKTLMLGKIEGRRRTGWQRMRWLDGITDSNGREFEQAPGVGERQGSLACYHPWGHRVGHNWATELNNKWNNSQHIMCWKHCPIFYFTFRKVTPTFNSHKDCKIIRYEIKKIMTSAIVLIHTDFIHGYNYKKKVSASSLVLIIRSNTLQPELGSLYHCYTELQKTFVRGTVASK